MPPLDSSLLIVSGVNHRRFIRGRGAPTDRVQGGDRRLIVRIVLHREVELAYSKILPVSVAGFSRYGR